jgi:halogenation protein CepH
MTRPTGRCDVVVIGGGPAGAAVATWLARTGHAVTLLERVRFPRHHIGESLLGMTMPLLHELGVDASLSEAGFVPKTGSLFRWNGHTFRLGMPHPGHAYQVDRSRFDSMLLAHARANGVNVAERSLVTALTHDPHGRVSGVEHTDDTGEPRTMAASWVIDATGLAQFAARRESMPIDLDGQKRLAVSGYFATTARPAPPRETDIITEAVRDGWLWFIPLSDEVVSVGFVTDTSQPWDSPAAALADQIATSVLVRPLLRDAVPTKPASVLRYTNHIVDRPLMRDGLVIVGDAAMFVDPLFSTGVHGALYSARLASAAVRSATAGGDEAALAAWYDRSVRAHYHRVRTMVWLLYAAHAGDSPFWRSMALGDVSQDRARQIVDTLGVSGAAFFIEPEHRALALPDTVVRELDRVVGPPAATSALPPGTAVRLSESIEVHEELVRAGDDVLPGIRLRCPTSRFEVSYPMSSVGGTVVRALRERPLDAGAAVAVAASSGHGVDVRTMRRLLGTLTAVGLLTRTNSDAGATQLGAAV